MPINFCTLCKYPPAKISLHKDIFAGAIPINFCTLFKYPPAKISLQISLQEGMQEPYRLTSVHFSSILLQRQKLIVFAGGYAGAIPINFCTLFKYLLQRYLCRRYAGAIPINFCTLFKYPPAKTEVNRLCRRVLEKCPEVNRYKLIVFAGGYLQSVRKLIGMAPAKCTVTDPIHFEKWQWMGSVTVHFAPAQWGYLFLPGFSSLYTPFFTCFLSLSLSLIIIANEETWHLSIEPSGLVEPLYSIESSKWVDSLYSRVFFLSHSLSVSENHRQRRDWCSWQPFSDPCLREWTDYAEPE